VPARGVARQQAACARSRGRSHWPGRMPGAFLDNDDVVAWRTVSRKLGAGGAIALRCRFCLAPWCDLAYTGVPARHHHFGAVDLDRDFLIRKPLKPTTGRDQPYCLPWATVGVARPALLELTGFRGISTPLIAFDQQGVTFKWKDYRIAGRDRYKRMTLATDGFIASVVLWPSESADPLDNVRRHRNRRR
jgi:hypothetical protein